MFPVLSTGFYSNMDLVIVVINYFSHCSFRLSSILDPVPRNYGDKLYVYRYSYRYI